MNRLAATYSGERQQPSAPLSCLVSGAPSRAGSPRVAIIGAPPGDQNLAALKAGFLDNGYVEGQNIHLDWLLTPADEHPEAAARALAKQPDALLALGGALAAKRLTSTIPIVFLYGDPVGAGLVASLSRPGGNATGLSFTGHDIVGRQLAVFKEIMPALRRLAILTIPAEPSSALYVEPISRNAGALGIEPVFLDIDDSKDVRSQIERIVAADVQATFALPFANLVPYNNDLYDFMMRTKIARFGPSPALRPLLTVAAYGPNFPAQYRQIVSVVASVLRGTSPADIPVQQPTDYDLSVNLSIAKAIGLAIPPSILAQATMVVE